MRYSFTVLSLLASTALSVEHNHRHARIHNRELSSEVVWVTDYDYVTTTLGVTTTVWVPAGQVHPTPLVESSSSQSSSTASSTVTPLSSPSSTYTTFSTSTISSTSTSSTPTPSSSAPGQFDQSTTSSPSPAPTPSETPSSSPNPESTPPPPPPPSSTSSTTVIAVTPPAVKAPVYTPPPVVAPTTAPAPVQSPAPVQAPPPASGGSGGQCSQGNACTGDITFYDVGLGSCGWTSVATDKIVALPAGLMGTQSNGNPYCGKTITIEYGGKTTTAKVVDKCPGCTGFSIDLSRGAFDVLAAEALGRTTASWYFNE